MIKGTICPLNPTTFVTPALFDRSLVGYVDLYLAKYTIGGASISSSLSGWYLDGNSTPGVQGLQNELMLPLNKNAYRIF